MEFQALEEALSGYYSIYSRYPPDSVAELGATEEYGTSESLYHYLVEGHGSKGTRKGHVYLETALLHAADIDGDGFPELVDAFGTPYLYAEGIGPSRTAAPVVRRAGMEPQGYDLVSAGPDRRLGGTFARSTGYVPARPGTTEEEYEEDNIAILGQRVPAQRAVQGLEGLE